MAKIKNSHSAPILTWKSKDNRHKYFLELKEKIVVGSDKYNKIIDINIPILSEIEFIVYCSNQNIFEIEHFGKKQLIVREKKEKYLAQGERYKIEEDTCFNCSGWNFIIYKPNHVKYLKTKLDMRNYAQKGRKNEKMSNKFKSKIISIENKVIRPTIIINDDPISIEKNKRLIMTDDFEKELKKPMQSFEPNNTNDLCLKRKNKNLKCFTKKFLKKTKGKNISDAIIIESSSSDEESNNKKQHNSLPIKVQENSICQLFYMNELNYFDLDKRKFFTIKKEDEEMNEEPKIKKKKEQSQIKTMSDKNNNENNNKDYNQKMAVDKLTFENLKKSNENKQLEKKNETENKLNNKNDSSKKCTNTRKEQIVINTKVNMQTEILKNTMVDDKKKSAANLKINQIISKSIEKNSNHIDPRKTNICRKRSKENEKLEYMKTNKLLKNQSEFPELRLQKSASKYAFYIYLDEEIKLSEAEIKELKDLDILVESNPLAKYGFYILNRFTKNLKNLIAFNNDVDFVNFEWVSQILKMKKIFDYNNFIFSDLNFSTIYDSSFNSLHLRAKKLNKMNEGFLKNYVVHIPNHYEYIELMAHLIKITGGTLKNDVNQNRNATIIYIALNESDVVSKKLKYYSINLLIEGCITHELDFDKHQFKQK